MLPRDIISKYSVWREEKQRGQAPLLSLVMPSLGRVLLVRTWDRHGSSSGQLSPPSLPQAGDHFGKESMKGLWSLIGL